MGLECGTVIGRIGRPGEGPYQLLAPIGAGHDTEVWQAQSLRSGKRVAVKVYPRWYGADRGYVQRFMRTARATQQAQHPSLLPLIEAGEDDGHTFLVTPLVEAGSLEERLDGRPWTLAATVALLEPLAAALDTLHARGVVHGNLKPSNVLLGECASDNELPRLPRLPRAQLTGASEPRADAGRPLLADPLVVRPVAASDAPGQFDLLLGSPTYASPEQASGTSLDTSPASDRYSLGVVAYQLLTGRPPFVRDAPLALLLDHIVKLPPSACALNPELPMVVERTLAVMLAKDPDRRYPTGAAFVIALRSALAATGARPKLVPSPSRTGLPASRPSGAEETHRGRGVLVPMAAGRRQTGATWRCRLAWSAP